jgi:hypothetical protein
MKMSLFAETIGGVRYRGHIQFNYWTCHLEIWGIGITHIIIHPRRGNFFKPTLERFFTRTTTYDTVFVEAIMSDKLLQP